MNTNAQSMPTGWSSLWRAHTQLPAELTTDEFTIYVRAIGRTSAHLAIRHTLMAMFGDRMTAFNLDEAYYNLSSASEMIEEGISISHVDRLFETGWCGSKVVAWAQNPVFVTPDANRMHQAWEAAHAG